MRPRRMAPVDRKKDEDSHWFEPVAARNRAQPGSAASASRLWNVAAMRPASRRADCTAPLPYLDHGDLNLTSLTMTPQFYRHQHSDGT